jgi:activator of HSP90 ATPase
MPKALKQEYEIKAPLAEVWKALVLPEYIEGWGGGPAKMDDKVGTEFSLWGGDIWGKNKEVVKEKKLVQDWFGGDWKEPSIATFELEEKDGETIVKLTHENLPEDDEDDFDAGWKDYYMGPMKEYLENK